MQRPSLISTKIVSAAAFDDSNNKMIRGGGVIATADGVEAVETATHNVLRGVNFYEAAAQGDFEGISNQEQGNYCRANSCNNPCGNPSPNAASFTPVCDNPDPPCPDNKPTCRSCDGMALAYYCE
jgi:hypothetical protein